MDSRGLVENGKTDKRELPVKLDGRACPGGNRRRSLTR